MALRKSYFPWSVLGYLTFLPEGFRDYFYDLVAENRYKLFGKKNNL